MVPPTPPPPTKIWTKRMMMTTTMMMTMTTLMMTTILTTTSRRASRKNLSAPRTTSPTRTTPSCSRLRTWWCVSTTRSPGRGTSGGSTSRTGSWTSTARTTSSRRPRETLNGRNVQRSNDDVYIVPNFSCSGVLVHVHEWKEKEQAASWCEPNERCFSWILASFNFVWKEESLGVEMTALLSKKQNDLLLILFTVYTFPNPVLKKKSFLVTTTLNLAPKVKKKRFDPWFQFRFY